MREGVDEATCLSGSPNRNLARTGGYGRQQAEWESDEDLVPIRVYSPPEQDRLQNLTNGELMRSNPVSFHYKLPFSYAKGDNTLFATPSSQIWLYRFNTLLYNQLPPVCQVINILPESPPAQGADFSVHLQRIKGYRALSI